MRADDTQQDPELKHPHPTQAIGQATKHHHEDSGEEGSDRYRYVHQVQRYAKVITHQRADIEHGLGEEPESEHSENQPQKEPIVTLEVMSVFCGILPLCHDRRLPNPVRCSYLQVSTQWNLCQNDPAHLKHVPSILEFGGTEQHSIAQT